jgi:hypothetical protein
MLSRTTEKLKIVTADEGEGFDPDHLPDPLSPVGLLEGPGPGIYLVRALTDEIPCATRPVRAGPRLPWSSLSAGRMRAKSWITMFRDARPDRFPRIIPSQNLFLISSLPCHLYNPCIAASFH